MKIQSAIASAALLGVLATSASAITVLDPVKALQPVKFEAPTPTKVIEPVMLPTYHDGNTVNLSMNIDAKGKPTSVRVLNVGDQAAYKHIIATVSQWEFSPARKNGQAVSTHVELPLEIKGL